MLSVFKIMSPTWPLTERTFPVLLMVKVFKESL